MATVATGTTAHCNRCDKPFQLKGDMTCGPFCGTKAARLEQFAKCPHCGQNDSHWIYGADVAPAFEGNFDARKRAMRHWLAEN